MVSDFYLSSFCKSFIGATTDFGLDFENAELAQVMTNQTAS